MIKLLTTHTVCRCDTVCIDVLYATYDERMQADTDLFEGVPSRKIKTTGVDVFKGKMLRLS